MSNSLVVAESKSIPKSLSDTDMMDAEEENSVDTESDLEVLDMSSSCCSQGKSVWILLNNHFPEVSVHIDFTNGEKRIEDVQMRGNLLSFEVPELATEEKSVEVRITTDERTTRIPVIYKKRQADSSFSLENLMEFASSGDALTLIQPFTNLIQQADIEGNTCMHIAAKNSQSFALKTLLSALSNEEKKAVVNKQNSRGQTALHCAIRIGDPDSVHYLLSSGADPNIQDSHKNNSVHYLAEAYNESIFKEIIEPLNETANDLEAKNEDGLTPLHLAVKRLKCSLIEMLLDAHANINTVDSNGRSALLQAVLLNDVEIIQLLIQRGADVNVEDDSGDTTVSVARKNGNYGIIGLLLDSGFDPERKNKNGQAITQIEEDEMLQKVLDGDRISLPTKEFLCVSPCDLAANREALFGRSNSRKEPISQRVMLRPIQPDDQNDEDGYEEEVVATAAPSSSSRFHELADEVEELLDHIDRPSTSSFNRQNNNTRAFAKDGIANLDYLTRIRLSKLLDNGDRWTELARELGCDHMIELIGICVDEDSSPSMLLLDQFEQLAEATITRVREALVRLCFDDAISLLDQRTIY